MSDPKTILEILREWLKAHGYDGLRDEDSECGCSLDDFAPCDMPEPSCLPAYRGIDSLMYLTREAAKNGGDDE